MIDQKAYLEAIKTPITENKTSKESEEFIFLEEEMTKFSSMRENTLDWKQAEKTAIVLLSEKTKNFRVLAHLLLCLQHDRDAERFILSIQLLNSFVELFWESSEPKIQPPKKELMIKKKILRQILIRTEQATSRLDLTEGDRALTPNLSQAMENLEKVVTKVGLEYEDFWKITTEFEKKLPPEVIVQKKISEPETNTSSPKQTSTDAPSSNSDIKSSELKLDIENTHETRQSLLKIATFLNNTFKKEPLGYRVRRFSLWFNVKTLPPLKKKWQY